MQGISPIQPFSAKIRLEAIREFSSFASEFMNYLCGYVEQQEINSGHRLILLATGFLTNIACKSTSV
jgi:fatty acid/phospholipid biosynthesis enzyme